MADVVSELVGADKSRLYPLYVNPKQQGKTSSGSGNGFRSKYIDFWEKFADHLRSAGDEDLEGLEGLRCLHTVLDQLIALSRTSVVNVRDAVTEAVLSCSLRLQYGGVELRTRVETVQRQLNAELKKLKDQSDKAKSSPRYQAIEKQKKRSNDMLKLMEEILSEIFTSTFVYRFKDVHEGVRALCVRRLCQHMCADPKEMIKDDNLKYIGWSCSDHSASVRLEAVKSVGTLIKIDTKNRNQSMKLFVERFNNRFIEIAGGDVDESISYSMIGILRTLCQQGELDRLSEKQLDQIDEIVFDGQVKENVRAEALGFFMDHTQGFDDEAEDDDTDHEVQATSQDSSKKAKISKKNKSDEESALRRQRNIALQLETLTEFAEHQLHSPGQIVLTDLLASAVLQSSKKGRIALNVMILLLLIIIIMF